MKSHLCSLTLLLAVFHSCAFSFEVNAQSWFKAGSSPGSYDMGGDPTVSSDSPGGGYIISNTSPINGFGTWMTEIPVNEYLGKAIKMTAYVKTINSENGVALWMRIDGAHGQSSLTFDNMEGRQIRGTTYWNNYEVVLDVPINAKRIYCGILMDGTGEAYVYGLKWELVPPAWEYSYIGASEIFSIKALDENVVWAGANNGVYLRTNNGGEYWTSGTVPGAGSLFFLSIAAINANTAYYAGTNHNATAARIFKTTDGGRNWTLQFVKIGEGVFFNSIAFWDEKNGIAVSDPVDGKFFIVTTNDGGLSWNEVPAGNIPPPLLGEWTGFELNGGASLAVSGSKHAWFGTGYGTQSENVMRIFKTSDQGRTWTAVNTALNNTGIYHGVSTIIFKDTLVGFANSTGSLSNNKNTFVKTVDGGKTWSLVPSFPEVNSSRLTFVPKDNDVNLFISSLGGYYYSKDFGGTWQHKKVGSTQKLSSVSFASPEKGWATGPNSSVIIKMKIGTDLTDVHDNPDAKLKEPLLSQNYPNPFHPSTTIDYVLPKPGDVTLKIFNLAGQELETLVNGFKEAGKHQLVWKPKGLPGGIYFYQLRAGEFYETRKLLLQK